MFGICPLKVFLNKIKYLFLLRIYKVLHKRRKLLLATVNFFSLSRMYENVYN